MGASGLGVLVEAGGGQPASGLLTSWMQYANVPISQETGALCWVRDISMASVHLHICAMGLMAGVLSFHLLTTEETPSEMPGQEPSSPSPNMTPCPPRAPHPWAPTMLTHMSCSILPRKVPLSPQPGERGG